MKTRKILIDIFILVLLLLGLFGLTRLEHKEADLAADAMDIQQDVIQQETMSEEILDEVRK